MKYVEFLNLMMEEWRRRGLKEASKVVYDILLGGCFAGGRRGYRSRHSQIPKNSFFFLETFFYRLEKKIRKI